MNNAKHKHNKIKQCKSKPKQKAKSKKSKEARSEDPGEEEKRGKRREKPQGGKGEAVPAGTPAPPLLPKQLFFHFFMINDHVTTTIIYRLHRLQTR